MKKMYLIVSMLQLVVWPVGYFICYASIPVHVFL